MELAELKSITYVSRMSGPFSKDQLEEIFRGSASNVSGSNITGILILCGDLFFQILEGEDSSVDEVLERIRNDDRHHDIQVLKVNHSIEKRQFPDWSMRTIDLDDTNDMLVKAMRVMLASLAESRQILERYTQPAIVEFLSKGINPLLAPHQTNTKVVLFGDIAAFDALSQFYSTEEVAEHAGSFLEVLSKAVARNGGQVNKYMGDKVLAYFALDRVDDAIRSCVESLTEIRALRANAAQCRLRNFLYGGFGLALGPVIEGNFGSSSKMDYTILGNTVNMAARMEALTRSTGRALMMDERVKNACQREWQWDSLGEFHLKGQATISNCFSLHDDVVRDTRTVDEMIEQVLSTTEEHRRNCLC